MASCGLMFLKLINHVFAGQEHRQIVQKEEEGAGIASQKQRQVEICFNRASNQ